MGIFGQFSVQFQGYQLNMISSQRECRPEQNEHWVVMLKTLNHALSETIHVCVRKESN